MKWHDKSPNQKRKPKMYAMPELKRSKCITKTCATTMPPDEYGNRKLHTAAARRKCICLPSVSLVAHVTHTHNSELILFVRFNMNNMIHSLQDFSHNCGRVSVGHLLIANEIPICFIFVLITCVPHAANIHIHTFLFNFFCCAL